MLLWLDPTTYLQFKRVIIIQLVYYGYSEDEDMSWKVSITRKSPERECEDSMTD